MLCIIVSQYLLCVYSFDHNTLAIECYDYTSVPEKPTLHPKLSHNL